MRRSLSLGKLRCGPAGRRGNVYVFQRGDKSAATVGRTGQDDRGAFTGSVTHQFGSEAFAGKFRQDGTADVRLRGSGYSYRGTSTSESLHFEYLAAEARFAGKYISDDYYVGVIREDSFSAERAAPGGPLAGRHTAAFAPSPSQPVDPAAPPGNGWMLITVNANGGVRALGRLGNGQPFSMSSRLRADGAFQFYIGTHVLRRYEDAISSYQVYISRDVHGVIRLHDGGESAERGGTLRWEEEISKRRPDLEGRWVLDIEFEVDLDVEVSPLYATADRSIRVRFSG